MKRFLSIVLAAVMVALCVPFSANVMAADCSEVGHTYIQKVKNPTCIDNGYTTYTCSVCGDEYVSDFVAPIKNGYGWYWTEDCAYGYTGDTGIREENIIIEYDACASRGYADGAEWSIWNEGFRKIVIDAENGLVYLRDDSGIVDSASYNWGELTFENWHHVKYTYEDGNVTVNIDGSDIGSWFVGSWVAGENFVGAFLFYSAEGVLVIDNWKVSDLDGNVLFLECFEGELPAFTNGLGSKLLIGESSAHRNMYTLKEPTCTTSGSYKVRCKDCNLVTYEVLEKLGHDYVAVVTPPTCTDEGYTVYTCSRCSERYKSDYVSALAHEYGWQWSEVDGYGYALAEEVTQENIIIEFDARMTNPDELYDSVFYLYNRNGYVAVDVTNNEIYQTDSNGKVDPVTYYWGETEDYNWHHMKYIYNDGNVTVNVDGEDIGTWFAGSCHVNENGNGFVLLSSGYYFTIDNWKVSDFDGTVLVYEDFEGDCSVFRESMGYKTRISTYASHDYVYTEVKATCTEMGSFTKYCNVCGYETTRYYNPSGHVESDWKVISEGVCVKECTLCGEELARKTIFAPDENSDFYIDGETGIVEGVSTGMTAETFAETCANMGITVTVTDADGNTPRFVGTGCVVTIGGREYTVCVKGDLTGDGITDAKDMIKLKKFMIGSVALEGVYLNSADTDGNGKVNAKDSFVLRKSLRND